MRVVARGDWEWKGHQSSLLQLGGSQSLPRKAGGEGFAAAMSIQKLPPSLPRPGKTLRVFVLVSMESKMNSYRDHNRNRHQSLWHHSMTAGKVLILCSGRTALNWKHGLPIGAHEASMKLLIKEVLHGIRGQWLLSRCWQGCWLHKADTLCLWSSEV